MTHLIPGFVHVKVWPAEAREFRRSRQGFRLRWRAAHASYRGTRVEPGPPGTGRPQPTGPKWSRHAGPSVATQTHPSQRKIRWSAPAPTQPPCPQTRPYRRRRPENTTLHRIVREHHEVAQESLPDDLDQSWEVW